MRRRRASSVIPMAQVAVALPPAERPDDAHRIADAYAEFRRSIETIGLRGTLSAFHVAINVQRLNSSLRADERTLADEAMEQIAILANS